MKYLWTEDRGAGLHFWQMVNQYFFAGEFVVESKGSNQGILDAVRALQPDEADIYYLAFDCVFDNMDVINKFIELKELVAKYPERIVLLDIICFEYIIFSFDKLVQWTGSGHKDAIDMRRHILPAVKDHMIDIDTITDEKTRKYLMGFRRYSTERVIKSLTYMLTDGDEWSIKGEKMGRCWHEDCCVLEQVNRRQCHIDLLSGIEKMRETVEKSECHKIISGI